MQQRLADLHNALEDLQGGALADEDAWSDSDEEAATAAAAAGDGSAAQHAPLVETERERQIRMGLITPFQNVAGVATGVTRDGAAPAAAGVPVLAPAPLMPSSTERAKLAATAKRVAVQRAATEANRQQVQFMDPADLDEDMLEIVRKPEWFKRRPSAAEARHAADMAKAAKHKRLQTLPRERRSGRKAKRRRKADKPKPTQQPEAPRGSSGGHLRRKSNRARVHDSDDDFSLEDVNVEDRQSGEDGEDVQEPSERSSSEESSSDSGLSHNSEAEDGYDDAGLLHQRYNSSNQLVLFHFDHPTLLCTCQ